MFELILVAERHWLSSQRASLQAVPVVILVLRSEYSGSVRFDGLVLEYFDI
jgi:hypothetical protein